MSLRLCALSSLLGLALLLPACEGAASGGRSVGAGRSADLNAAARSYVTWTLALRELTAGSSTGMPADLDLPYYGPSAWQRDADVTPTSVRRLAAEAGALASRLAGADGSADDRARRRWLRAQLRALSVEADAAAGAGGPRSFDEETRALYGIAPPPPSAAAEAAARHRLEALLPGRGPLAARYASFERRLVVPPSRLRAVMTAALQACRARTRQHIPLPAGEQLEVDYVRGEAWNADAEYRGRDLSVIHIDLDHPLTVDRVLDLACHEGYPGHHVFDLLADERLVQSRGWQELTVRPVASPAGFVAEAVANFAPDVAFPGASRLAFERNELFPLAGVDPRLAAPADQIRQALDRLAPAIVDIARAYLDGRLDRGAAARALGERAALPDPQAMIRFIDRYRTYVIAYTMGKQLVRQYVDSRGGTPDRPDRRWQVYETLLGRPVLPDDLGSRE